MKWHGYRFLAPICNNRNLNYWHSPSRVKMPAFCDAEKHTLRSDRFEPDVGGKEFWWDWYQGRISLVTTGQWKKQNYRVSQRKLADFELIFFHFLSYHHELWGAYGAHWYILRDVILLVTRGYSTCGITDFQWNCDKTNSYWSISSNSIEKKMYRFTLSLAATRKQNVIIWMNHGSVKSASYFGTPCMYESRKPMK